MKNASSQIGNSMYGTSWTLRVTSVVDRLGNGGKQATRTHEIQCPILGVVPTRGRIQVLDLSHAHSHRLRRTCVWANVTPTSVHASNLLIELLHRRRSQSAVDANRERVETLPPSGQTKFVHCRPCMIVANLLRVDVAASSTHTSVAYTADYETQVRLQECKVQARRTLLWARRLQLAESCSCPCNVCFRYQCRVSAQRRRNCCCNRAASVRTQRVTDWNRTDRQA